MKILFIIHDNGLGGIWAVTERLAKGFITRGIDATILILAPELTGKRVIHSGIPFIHYQMDVTHFKDMLKGKFLKTVPKIRKIIKEGSYDIVISSYFNVNFIALLAVKNTRTKIIVCDHGLYHSRHFPIKKHWLNRKIKDICYFLMSLSYRKADKIVAASEGIRKELTSFFKLPDEKVLCIYNPLPSNIQEAANIAPPHPWFEDGGKPIILAAARLEDYGKNLSLLLRAVAKVHQNFPCRLIILGDGEDRQKLEKLAKDLGVAEDVSMPGITENPYAYMAHADVLVLSSNFEGWGLALIEALACGCPVISTDCPCGPREILENGKYGKLVPVNDVNAMAQAITEVIVEGKVSCSREERIARGQDFIEYDAVKQYADLCDSTLQKQA